MPDRKLWLPALLLLVLAAALSLPGKSAQADAPSDGVYDIAILTEGTYTHWQADGDFTALLEAPGEFDYSATFIDSSDLVSVLDDYDVLIIPWAHAYFWLDSAKAAAIMKFVADGGTLVIHAAVETCLLLCPETSFDDSLLAFFGDDYSINWQEDSETDDVKVIDAANPLASMPNMLTTEGLSDWTQSAHSVVLGFGSAWHWATATNFDDAIIVQTEGPTAETSQQSGQIAAQQLEEDVEQAMVAGCADYGKGVIVVSGQDPEFHAQDDETPPDPMALLLIENEVTIDKTGCVPTLGRQGDNQRPQPPNIGGALAGLFAQGQPTPLPTTPPAPAARTGNIVISPPNTGDAGLADRGGVGALGYSLAALALLPLAGLAASRLLRR